MTSTDLMAVSGQLPKEIVQQYTATCERNYKNANARKARPITQPETLSSVTENEAEQVLNVYPNPNNGQATIAYSTIGVINPSIQIVNIYGQVLQFFSLESETTSKLNIDLTNYSPGIYLCQLKTGNNNIEKVIKVIVER